MTLDTMRKAETRRPSCKLLLLLLLPVLAYAGMMILSVRQRAPLWFVGTDLALLMVVLTYTCIGMWLVTCRPAIHVVRFLACVYSILIAGALGEAALRSVRPPFENTPMPRIHTTYFPSADLPGISGPIEFTVNDLGVRGPAVRLEDVDLRILCVGGSTTECMYQTDKRSWPWLFQDSVASKTGKSVFVGNAGRSGQITLNHEYLLKHYPCARRFEWVVLFCGWNDMIGMLSIRNYETRKTTVEQVTLHDPVVKNHRTFFRDLAFVRALGESFGNPERPPGILQDTAGYWMEKERLKRREALKSNTIDEVPRIELHNALVIYKQNLERIIDLCRKQGQQLIIMNQPTIYRKDLPENLERLTWSYRDDGAFATPVLEQLMDAFNQATSEVCRREGIRCLDLAIAVPKDGTMFFDDVHLTDAGCEKVAAVLSDYFVAGLHGSN